MKAPLGLSWLRHRRASQSRAFFWFSFDTKREHIYRTLEIREHQSRSEDHRKTCNAHCKVDIILSAQVSLELHHRISQFLFHEASLLDDWKFRDWLAQLDEEIRYTMRTTVNAQTRDRRKGVQPG